MLEAGDESIEGPMTLTVNSTFSNSSFIERFMMTNIVLSFLWGH